MAPLEDRVFIYEQEGQFVNETSCHIPLKIFDSWKYLKFTEF